MNLWHEVLETGDDGFAVIVHVDGSEEFASEIGFAESQTEPLAKKISNYVRERFSNVNRSVLVKVMAGTAMLGTLTVGGLGQAKAAEIPKPVKTFKSVSKKKASVDGVARVMSLQSPFTASQHAVVKQRIVKDSYRYLGVPYRWGGTTPAGFDCSGFVYFMFTSHGVHLPRETSGALFQKGTPISRNNLKPGDLVFFAVQTPSKISHVGIYVGNNEFISATSSKGIAVASMNNPYWAPHYKGAKRIY